MQSYTNQADLLYREAEEIDLNQELSFPYNFYCKPIMQQQFLYSEAREMENAARSRVSNL